MISYCFEGMDKVPSPALIYYRDQILKNTGAAIEIAGGAHRLWPHVKTHKMRQIIDMQLKAGIERFKCATYAEARLTAECGAKHVLWAYPIVGPNAGLFLRLVKDYPQCVFYALADSLGALGGLSRAAQANGLRVNALCDVNPGMNRTGLSPEDLPAFYRAARDLPGVRLRGLHIYDGHIHDAAPDGRARHAAQAVAGAIEARGRLLREGFDAGILILGGTPTFPCHAAVADAFLSPGTLFVSDAGYQRAFPDIGVTPAAAVLTRVISHPGDGLFTLDAGHKAVSSDSSPRGVLVGYEDKCEPVLVSEEHWVFKMKPEFRDQRPAIAQALFVIPAHICTTTYLYDAAYVCSGGRLTDIWPVAARARVGDINLSEVLSCGC